MKKATKVITYLTGLFLLALGSLQAQDSAHPAADSSRPVIAVPDSTTQPARDTTAQGSAPAGDTVALPKEIGDTVALPKENSAPARDTTQKDNNTAATDNP